MSLAFLRASHRSRSSTDRITSSRVSPSGIGHVDSLQCADRRGRWHTPFERVGFRGGHAARCSALACEKRVDGAKPGFVTSRERALTFSTPHFDM